MKVQAIVAHPDDAAIFCGGTLAKHADRGDEVVITYLTRGEYGGDANAIEMDLKKVREQEAANGAELLGADTTFLDFKDGHITSSLENRRTVLSSIRKQAPDYLITHFHDDMHPDHRSVSTLVTDAYYMASLELVKIDSPPCDPANVYFFGKPTASSFDPDTIVDITDQQETKEEACLEHESQIEWLTGHGGIDGEYDDLLETLRARARILGTQTGVTFGEGFERLHGEAVEYLS